MRLTAQGLGHAFDDGQWLFRNVDLELLPGHIYALTGPSGSGKSTLLGIFADLVSPREGHIERSALERIGWVFQNPHGVPGRSTRDHVALPLLARGDSVATAEKDADALLARFAINHLADRPFRSLSGGEAQRLMLARAVAAGPDLLLIDEPTAQLDAHTAAIVSRSITATAGDDAIVVVATHDARTRDACTDHIDLAPALNGHGIRIESLR